LTVRALSSGLAPELSSNPILRVPIVYTIIGFELRALSRCHVIFVRSYTARHARLIDLGILQLHSVVESVGIRASQQIHCSGVGTFSDQRETYEERPEVLVVETSWTVTSRRRVVRQRETPEVLYQTFLVVTNLAF
jgi:hypothetical protein